MNKRNLRLDKYDISSKRYKELCGFCEQYPEWKHELESFSYMSGVKYSDMPKNPNMGTADTTGEYAVRRAMLEKKCKIIEDTAKQADEENWKFLIWSACYEYSVTYLQMNGMYMGKSAFYERRRYFFFLLNRVKL